MLNLMWRQIIIWRQYRVLRAQGLQVRRYGHLASITGGKRRGDLALISASRHGLRPRRKQGRNTLISACSTIAPLLPLI